MNEIKQSAWSKQEDTLLANTVLKYIREGKTQLAAFNHVAKQLSRTPAACGFRWNATIRKQYEQEIQFAKRVRKKSTKMNNDLKLPYGTANISEQIHTAITLLESLRSTAKPFVIQNNKDEYINRLQKENELLKKKLLRYEEAWQEIQKIGAWVYKEE